MLGGFCGARGLLVGHRCLLVAVWLVVEADLQRRAEVGRLCRSWRAGARRAPWATGMGVREECASKLGFTVRHHAT
jgi:hypothetical protein